MLPYSGKVLNRFKKPKNVGSLKNPDGIGEVGNLKCLIGNQQVHINNKIISMAELNIGNRIISHDGQYHPFSAVHKRQHSGKIIILKNKLGKTALTEDHLVYAIKIPNKRKYFDTKVKKGLAPAWYHAGALAKRDIILYPLFNEVSDKKYIEPDLSKNKYDFKSIQIPGQIQLSPDFLRLCGYFLAEGHANVKASRNSVTLCFNINEERYIQDVQTIVKSVFGLHTYVGRKPETNTAIVIINNVFVAKLFKELFGSGAAGKKIPDFMMLLPPGKQKHLICGMWRGDGHITFKRKFPRASYTTISEQLIQQMKILLLRQKIAPSLYSENESIKKGVHHKAAYRIHVDDRNSLRTLMSILSLDYYYCQTQKDHSWFDENYFYTPLSGYEAKPYNGLVYNLEVPETHSFVTNSLLVHNCGDIMKVYIKVKDGRIKDIKFETFGCVAAIASSDALCDLAKGKTLDDALKITDRDIANELGGLPQIKFHCSVLGSRALHAAIDDYRKKHPEAKKARK